MGIFDFLKNKRSKSSMDKFEDQLPNLYQRLPSYVHDAVRSELATYSFTEAKKNYVAAKIEGSLAGTFYFDDVFITKMASLSTDPERVQLIRDYLRAYIKREINLESANLINEAKNKVLNSDSKNPKSVFQVFDPRWKKGSKPGDYDNYDKYRKDVTEYLFPQIKVTEKSKDNSSAHLKDAKSVVEEFNKSGGTAFIGPGARLGGPAAAKDALNGVINSRYKYISAGAEVYNSEYGGFLSVDQQIILSNIKHHQLIKSNLSATQIVDLLSHVQAGNLAGMDNYLVKGADTSKVLSGLKDTSPKVEVDSKGVATLIGKDGIKNLYETSTDIFEKKVSKDPNNAIIDVQQSLAVANITTAKSLIQANRGGDTSDLTAFLDKNQSISDILNLSKALKDAKNLSGDASSSLNLIKSRVLNNAISGKIQFSSENEKNEFIKALNSNNAKYFKNLVTPGLVGSSVFAKMVADVNDKALDIAGKYNDSNLAIRSLNFNNYFSMYKSTVLNTYIYTAQMGFDAGYMVSEIKKTLKDNQFFKLVGSSDTTISWESIKQKLRTGSVDLFSKVALAAGIKNVDKAALNSILDLYSGKTTFGKLLEARLEAYFKKSAGGFKKALEFSWKEILKSPAIKSLTNWGKLKLLKNLRYLEKVADIGFKKISAPLPAVIGKLFGSGWGVVTRFTKGFFSRVGKYLLPPNIFGDFDGIAKAFVIGVISIGVPLFIFYLFVILIMSVFNAANNSSSIQSTNFQIGAVNDVVYASFQQYNQKLEILPTISSSGNVCLAPNGQGFAGATDWNNLKLSDFDGTDNTNNCKVMCNARKYLGGLSPGSEKNLNCNINKNYIPRPGRANEYVCADFVVDTYFDDDPEMTKQGGSLVIAIDKYLKGASDKYEKIDLAIPNTINDTTPAKLPELSQFNYTCNDLSSFQPGNILIDRVNTCNDIFQNGNYITTDLLGNRVSTYNGHIELVLKVEDAANGNKTLWTINANHLKKKIAWKLIKCPSTPDKYYVQPKEGGIYLSGTTIDGLRGSGAKINDLLTTVYPCRIYQMKQRTNMTCFDKCQLLPNNYPDGTTYQTP